ncbi:glycoside hydrolase family 13 protein [Streptomyces sp. TLI_171]|uniref:glycoside hydrolase family 13 protein n=1 Tax=Streptomyces sp. TLI_171 TaxID=1938859 RepID=UPI000C18E4A2|nr:glycoside hydrolase family 13 protein [Streptomyces sp. TLI_171]RKE22753.1 alpha-glucosidase [Streptomyces sp. TLI_171]
MSEQWWRNAAIYQVYPRSFADGNGDGIGDLAGVRAKLSYLAELGVDAIWFNPWYPSPMADGGYDVADYRGVEPVFGTLAEAEQLIDDAAGLGLRTIVDIVPNHVSDQHPWFQAALAAGIGSPERELFHFRAGRGADGELPPNDWKSEFGGCPWTRLPDGQWYLHLFATAQPDLNWAHPAVRQEHLDILRFWFDRGAAGVRIDSAGLLTKDPELADVEPGRPHPYIDRDDLHDIYRSWRAVADSYPTPRVLIGEIWVPDAERFARYLRPDEMHTAFNFDFLARPWDAAALRESIDTTLAAHAPVGAPATWVLANHDVTRTITRYGREDTRFQFATKAFGTPTDLELGRRRARAAALLTMALPGSLYLYQGEELGLPEVEDLPLDTLQDPMHFRSGGTDPGRDGCRVPLPWSGNEPPYGFTRVGKDPWLPQPLDWAPLTVEAQSSDPGSMLSLYREGIRLRAELLHGEFHWDGSAPTGVLSFRRGDIRCLVNLSASPLPLDGEVVLASADLTDGRLPPDTAVWLR